jgi:hypothetical protein
MECTTKWKAICSSASKLMMHLQLPQGATTSSLAIAKVKISKMSGHVFIHYCFSLRTV